jgi:UDP-N-acetyl-alpha-D-muramoyl-L-alanyl-L-glutamate epimerase
VTDSPTPAPLTPDSSIFEISGYEWADGILTARFRGVVNGLARSFAETVDFGEAARESTSSRRPTEVLLRLLALTLSPSYYKATRAQTVQVGFPVSRAERAYLRILLEHGLGEYAYVNAAEWKLTPEIVADERDDDPAGDDGTWSIDAPPLAAVGGGKDSIVSIEALKAAGRAPVLFSVNGLGAIGPSIAVAERPAVTLRRTIDPALLRAGREGAPNGHVPVTAINSVIGLVAAELLGCGPVVFSNEESADHGNLEWNGRLINHQWSKSLEYEDLLRDTLAADGLSPDRYFSLLRGFREIEIARAFAQHPQYFSAFTSCNRAYVLSPDARSAGWCGECDKCRFVFLILAPYLGRERLVGVFGRDLLDEPAQRGGFVDILGLGDQKPFDCVGEPSEAVEALHLIEAGGQWADSELVQALSELTPLTAAATGHGAGDDRVPAAFAPARDRVAAA